MADKTLTLETAIERHLIHLKARAYTPATLESRAWLLGLFRWWADERGLLLMEEVTPSVIGRYQRHLAQHRKEDGQPLCSRTQRTRLVPLRTFGKWALREKLVDTNPVADLNPGAEARSCGGRLRQLVSVNEIYSYNRPRRERNVGGRMPLDSWMREPGSN